MTSRILIIDDEPAIVAGIQGVLALHDIDARGARDGQSAEQMIATEFFPVILADLRLRTEDEGLRLLERARELSPRSRVATMTGYADHGTEARVRELGAHLVLRKPFEERELMGAVRAMLEAVESAHAGGAGFDLDALYTSTLPTLKNISRGRYRFPADDAEELIQETWLLFLQKRESVRSPESWLAGTIANLCRQSIERRTRERERSSAMPDAGVEPKTDQILAVRQALARVDARSQMLLSRIGLERESYEAVSEASGIPIGSVGPLYMRAKRRMQKAIAA